MQPRSSFAARPALVLVLGLVASCGSPEDLREFLEKIGHGGGGGVDGGAGGLTCGGPMKIPCPEDLYCDSSATAPRCGGDAPGICMKKPEVCTEQYQPVCGCDGKTYGNDCIRQAAGVSKLRDGECNSVVEVGEGEDCGGFRPPPQRVCKKGLSCNPKPGQCSGPAADAPGVCEAVPTACTREFAPVCGCDGKTYGNDCTRKAASVGLDHKGECKRPPGGEEGAMCGGIAGFPCKEGLFCQLAPGSCRIADAAGVCARKPETCTLEYAPVCGCDGKTYGNDCARQAAGVSKLRDGECNSVVEVGEGEDCGGFRASPQRVCKKGLSCNPKPGQCSGPAADAPGVCEAVPTACTREFAPVCGCDGKTYGNDCTRKAASVGLNHTGECKRPPGGEEGAMCGGFAGLPCKEGLFCQLAPGSCRIADAAGVCARKPEACTLQYAPVCGCDGKTYGNDCARQGAGVSKDHDGECGTARELTPGVWGGEHAALTARGSKAISTIEFDCARGMINGPLLLEPNGRFRWRGTFTREGGPEPVGGRPSESAIYFGNVFAGNVMELSVSLTGGELPAVKLALGQRPRLVKCR